MGKLLTNAEIESIRARDCRGSLDLFYLLKDREERTRLLREVLRIYSVPRCDEDKCGQCDGVHDRQLDDSALLAEIREAVKERRNHERATGTPNATSNS